MEYSSLQLIDLPDEILLIIFKKLDNVALLYSLFDINKRLNQILYDSIFTDYLNLVEFCPNDSSYRLSDPIRDRFCLEILPKIHHQIKGLDLEPSSMECILRATNYPNLYGLGLYDLKIEKGKHLFTDETPFTDLFKNQILSLVIDISKNDENWATENLVKFIFLRIFPMFTNLKYLHIASSSSSCQQLSFGISPPSIFSSNLLELHVNLDEFTDCLYLLDGRLSQLHTFHASIDLIGHSPLLIDNRKKLPNLRCFVLYCDMVIYVYDQLIVPLLHRMSNLQELSLNLAISKEKTFIDGNNLKNLVNDMACLKKFTFNIRSIIPLDNQIDFLSNEYIENTFKNFKYNEVICCVDYFSESEDGQCHIYSYPYIWEEYMNITNHFPGGLFKCVREISLFDERPFEHEFLLRISQSFPLTEILTLINNKQQKNKQCRKSKDDNQHLSIIKYPHLTELHLYEAHEDYIEQFLVHAKTCLPNNVYLFTNHRLLIKVTHNFTRDTTRINCSKINYLHDETISELPKHFKDYFLHTRAII